MRAHLPSALLGAIAMIGFLLPQQAPPPPVDLAAALAALATPAAQQTPEEQAVIDALNAHIDQRIANAPSGDVTQAEFDTLVARVDGHDSDITTLQGSLESTTDIATQANGTATSVETELERVKTELRAAGGDTGDPPAPDPDWPAHWPQPQELGPDEIDAVRSARYLYSTWYGSPQGGLSPAAALAAHRGAAFEPFLQFGENEYVVPAEQSVDILGRAIIDAAAFLCPDATWPTKPDGARLWPIILGPGDSLHGWLETATPVHCYWSHPPGAEWNAGTLEPSPSYDEIWGR